MKSSARVVVIGGGAVGANILYSLTRRGWSDVVLCERTELTAGSTWHAAGLIPLYSHNRTYGRMVMKTIAIYEGLEAETGQSIGWHKCGSLRTASDATRMDEFLTHASRAETQGVEARILTRAETLELWPLIEGGERILGGVHHPHDGHLAPADVTQALAKGAVQRGAAIYRNTEVIGIERRRSGDWRVRTNRGDIDCEHVVTATGNYARQTARMVDLDIPALPIVHQYMITEPVPEIAARRKAGQPEMPILKDDRFIGYLREERGGLMFGPYERPEDLELFAVDGVPDWFGASLLPEKLEPVMGHIEAAVALVPAFGRAGIASHVRGPICTTPDNLPLAGPAPGLTNFWLAEGVSGGLVMGGGLGHYLAEMIVEGGCEIDFSGLDPRRFGDHATKAYACIKNREAFGNLFGVNLPDYEWPMARPAKTAPSYDRLTAHGAVWGAANGWEVPLWFAPEGVARADVYGYRGNNYDPHVAEEHRAARTTAGLADLTATAKFEVSGRGAADWLDSLVACHVPAEVDGLATAHLLTERGTIECEFTLVRLAEDHFYLTTAPRAERLAFDILAKNAPENGTVNLRNVTTERGVLGLVGPEARALLAQIAESDLSSAAFPWPSARTGAVGLAPDVRLLRTGSTGELGWELHHPIAWQLHLLDLLLSAGVRHGLRLVGARALDSLRLEKSVPEIGHELGPEMTAWESGLDRSIALDKPDFPGRAALIAQRAAGPRQRLATLRLADGPGAAHGGEAIHGLDGRLVGRVTSAGHGHALGVNLALGYLDPECSAEGNSVTVSILNEKRAALVIPPSPYDPDAMRAKA